MVIRRTSPRAEALLESAADVWVAEHPDEDPPMVDDIGVVGGWGEPSPAAIVFRTGTVVIACGTEDGAIHVAGTVEVSG